MPQPQRPQTQVFWLDDWPRASTREPAPEPAEASVASTVTPLAEPALENRASSIEESPPVRPPPRRRPAAATVEPKPRADAPTAPSPADQPKAASVPEVDWEKERHDAVHDVLEQRASRREYLTFSLDDLVKPEPEPDPFASVLPPLVVDHCLIVKGKLQRFAALMTGRCVREARGDLFAAIKPAYLKAHPVCIETRPDSPGSFLSDGTQISTVKCELVAGEQ